VHVESARAMLEAVEQALPADIGIFAAAVADWRVANAGEQKIKKKNGVLPNLSLTENPDILATVSRRAEKRPPLMVGFAAETEHVIEHARQKLAKKGCDLIVANDVSAEAGVMGGDSNTVHLVTTSGVETWPTLPKNKVAQKLVERLGAMMQGAGS
jgi:phosphopantothenoylcysteine decarboxylase/phosphopantothenate--cysteine ligase